MFTHVHLFRPFFVQRFRHSKAIVIRSTPIIKTAARQNKVPKFSWNARMVLAKPDKRRVSKPAANNEPVEANIPPTEHGCPHKVSYRSRDTNWDYSKRV
eukprot:420556-Pyramimonas_sp.AAC.2